MLQVLEPLARLSVGASCWLLNYLDTDERGPMSSGLQDTVWSFVRWQKVIPSDAVRTPPAPSPPPVLIPFFSLLVTCFVCRSSRLILKTQTESV